MRSLGSEMAFRDNMAPWRRSCNPRGAAATKRMIARRRPHPKSDGIRPGPNERRPGSIGGRRAATELLRIERDVAHHLARGAESRGRLAVDLDLQPAGVAGGQ